MLTLRMPSLLLPAALKTPVATLIGGQSYKIVIFETNVDLGNKQ
jgi:hypothetical protein